MQNKLKKHLPIFLSHHIKRYVMRMNGRKPSLHAEKKIYFKI